MRNTKHITTHFLATLLPTIFSLLLISPTVTYAERLLETAPLGTTNGGNSIYEWQYFGARFTLTNASQITGIGGHIKSSSSSDDRSVFVAIVPTSGADNLPSDTTLSNAIYTAVFEPPFNDSGPYPYQVAETIIPTDFILEPGNYAIVFGSGLFGATGQGWMPLSGSSQDTPWLIQMRTEDFGNIQYWRQLNEQPMRFVIEGTLLSDLDVSINIEGGAEQECTDDGGTVVRLDALIDRGNPASITWSIDDIIVGHQETINHHVELGQHPIQLDVITNDGSSGSSVEIINIIDTSAPQIVANIVDVKTGELLTQILSNTKVSPSIVVTDACDPDTLVNAVAGIPTSSGDEFFVDKSRKNTSVRTNTDVDIFELSVTATDASGNTATENLELDIITR
ncbi:MAG: hypothetical protein ACQ9ET_01710 [Nitrosomonadaceae bacterium]